MEHCHSIQNRMAPHQFHHFKVGCYGASFHSATFDTWWLKASVNWQRAWFILGRKTKCKVNRCTGSSAFRMPDNYMS